MAVWGRAVTVLAILSALAGLTACEYADDGDPRPSAVASSSPPAVSAPPESTPDPEQEKRTARMLNDVATLLEAQHGESGYEVSGPIGDPIPLEGGDLAPTAGGLTASFTIPAGQYIVASACLGDTGAQLTLTDQNGLSIGRPHSCGEVSEAKQDLLGGMVTVELRGKTKGNEAVGIIRLSGVPSKAAPKP